MRTNFWKGLGYIIFGNAVAIKVMFYQTVLDKAPNLNLGILASALLVIGATLLELERDD